MDSTLVVMVAGSMAISAVLVFLHNRSLRAFREEVRAQRLTE